MINWIYAKDRLPKPKQLVLIYDSSSVGQKLYVTEWWKGAKKELCDFDYWAEINLPEQEKKE